MLCRFLPISSYYAVMSSERIGGLNHDGSRKIVEIDESFFFKRKYVK
jgi:hypothetical protein